MTDCAFCEIAQGAPVAGCLERTEELFVLLDRDSLGFGHCMIVPVLHVAKVYELPGDVRQRFFDFAATMAARLESALGRRSVGLVAFGSGFAHAHLHLVPHDDPDVLKEPKRHVRRKSDEQLASDVEELLRLLRSCV